MNLYRARGVVFISLQAAEKDPFYRVDTDLTLPPGPNTLDQAMAERHVPPIAEKPDAFDVSALCR